MAHTSAVSNRVRRRPISSFNRGQQAGPAGVDGDAGQFIVGRDGEDGESTTFFIPSQSGTNGTNGTNGGGLTVPGRDAEDGVDGFTIPGEDGLPGLPGATIPGADGEDGQNAFQFPPAQNGIDGIPGPPGFAVDGDDGFSPPPMPGLDGTPGRDSFLPGRDGEDADPPFQYPPPSNGRDGATIVVPGRDGDDADPVFQFPPAQNGIDGQPGPPGFAQDGEDGFSAPPMPGIPGADGSIGRDGLFFPVRDGEDGEPGLSIKGDKGDEGDSLGMILETPSGLVDGVNTDFELSREPATLLLFLNGLKQAVDDDYTLDWKTITFVDAPLEDDVISAVIAAGPEGVSEMQFTALLRLQSFALGRIKFLETAMRIEYAERDIAIPDEVAWLEGGFWPSGIEGVV